MTPDELRVLPGGEEPIPRNGSWGGSRTGFYPADFIHPAAGSYPYPWEYEPEHKAEYLFALTIVMVVLSTLVVAVRIGSRVMLRTLGVDDWLIIGATVGVPSNRSMLSSTNSGVVEYHSSRRYNNHWCC